MNLRRLLKKRMLFVKKAHWWHMIHGCYKGGNTVCTHKIRSAYYSFFGFKKIQFAQRSHLDGFNREHTNMHKRVIKIM